MASGCLWRNFPIWLPFEKKKKKKKNTFSINYSSTIVLAIFEQGLIQQPEVNKQLNFFSPSIVPKHIEHIQDKSVCSLVRFH